MKACSWQGTCVMLKHASSQWGYLPETLICLQSSFRCKSHCQAECCSPFFSGWGGVQWFPSCPQFLVPLSLLPCSWRVLLPSWADSASVVAVLCTRPVRCFDLGAICLGFFKEQGALLEVLFLNSMCERAPSLPVVRQAAELGQGKGVVALLCGQGGMGVVAGGRR